MYIYESRCQSNSPKNVIVLKKEYEISYETIDEDHG